jgi:hypothetical protein
MRLRALLATFARRFAERFRRPDPPPDPPPADHYYRPYWE